MVSFLTGWSQIVLLVCFYSMCFACMWTTCMHGPLKPAKREGPSGTGVIDVMSHYANAGTKTEPSASALNHWTISEALRLLHLQGALTWTAARSLLEELLAPWTDRQQHSKCPHSRVGVPSYGSMRKEVGFSRNRALRFLSKWQGRGWGRGHQEP